MGIADPARLINQSFADPRLQLQPAGVDLTVDEVMELLGEGELDFSNQHRRLPEHKPLAFGEGKLRLAPGAYLVRYREEVAIPPDALGLILPRSSLMRMGAVLHSAVWDPGYRGRGVGLMAVFHPLTLHQGARIGQLILIRLACDPERLYQGSYQGEGTEKGER